MTADKGHVELFERYRNGDLSERELIEFEARLVYDSEFKEDFDKYETLEVGIKVHFRNELKSKFQGMDKLMDNPAKKRTDPRRCLIWSSAIAACLLIGVFLFQHFSSSKNALLAKEYWPEEPGLPVKMSSKGKYDDAMNAYKLGDYETAERIFRTFHTDTSYYFLGIISFENEKTQLSTDFFTRVNSSSFFYNKAQFRVGLLYLKADKRIEAYKILRKQIADSTEFSEVSKEILKKDK